MTRIVDAHAWPTWLAIAVLLGVAAAVWIPALAMPFWGDDYSFLLDAHAANVARESWATAFWPDNPAQFWRPLSQESWWRFVDLELDADARHAHLANLILLLLAAVGVGLLAFSISRTCDWPQPGEIAVLSSAIYGTLALHLLPVHWAAAANSSILVVFTSLILAAWVSAPAAKPHARMLYLTCIPLLLVAALLSKESAVLTPALMLILSLFVGNVRRGKPEALTWLACCMVVIGWLLLRARFTIERIRTTIWNWAPTYCAMDYPCSRGCSTFHARRCA